MKKFWKVSRWILLVLLLVIAGALYYMSKAGMLSFDGRLEQPLAVHQEVGAIILRNEEDTIPADLAARLEEQIVYLEDSVETLGALPIYPVLLTDMYMFRANDLALNGSRNAAVASYNQAIQQIENASPWYPTKQLTLAQIHNHLYLVHVDNGDLAKARFHIAQAVAYYEEEKIQHWIGLGRMNLAKLNSLTGDYAAAMENTDLAIAAYARTDLRHQDSTFLVSAYRRRAADNARLAAAAAEAGDNRAAQAYADKAYKAFEFVAARKNWFTASEQTFQWPALLQDIAISWLDSPLSRHRDELKKMLDEIETGLENSVRPGLKDYRSALRLMRAEWLQLYGDEQEAAELVSAGMEMLEIEIDEDGVLYNRNTLGQKINILTLLLYTRLVPKLLRNRPARDVLEAQMSVVKILQSRGRYLSKDFRPAVHSRLESEIYDRTLATAWPLVEGYPEVVNDINFIAEGRRAQILQQTFQKELLVAQLDGPASEWLERDLKFRDRLARLEALRTRTEDEALGAEIEIEMAEVLQARADFRERPASRSVSSIAASFQLPTVPLLAELQSAIRPDEALIQFVAYRDRLAVVSITKNKVFTEFSPKMEDWEEALMLVDSAGNEDITQGRYVEVTHEVYKACLGPTLDSLPAGIEQVTFIKDGSLGDINLGMLARERTRAGGYATIPYLFKEYTISYAYLLSTYLTNARDGESYTGGELLVCAPDYSTVPPACDSVEVLPQLRALAESLTAPAGTGRMIAPHGEALRTASGSAKRVFFAGHGKIDTDRPLLSRLVVSPTPTEDCRVPIGEIMNWKVPRTDFTLGSCVTEAGTHLSGSGILSIAQAMTIAGARSLVANTQSVKDESTAIILAAYFTYLDAGVPKAEALQRALIDYLDTADNEILPPMYWANIVLIGHRY